MGRGGGVGCVGALLSLKIFLRRLNSFENPE